MVWAVTQQLLRHSCVAGRRGSGRAAIATIAYAALAQRELRPPMPFNWLVVTVLS